MRLLYVEGSESAAKYFVDSTHVHSGPEWHVQRVKDAYEAIDYLCGFKHFADRARFPLPQIVWLSGNARTRDGVDLLAWLRGEHQFRGLPVLVASSEARCLEMVSAYELAPQSWFAKPADGYRLLRYYANVVVNRWLTPKADKSQKHWPSHRQQGLVFPLLENVLQ